MKRRNSVFNNFNNNKYSSDAKKNRNGLLNTQNEFARDFFEDNSTNECEEVRRKDKSHNEYQEKNKNKS